MSQITEPIAQLLKGMIRITHIIWSQLEEELLNKLMKALMSIQTDLQRSTSTKTKLNSCNEVV
jgi:hypothetical protein